MKKPRLIKIGFLYFVDMFQKKGLLSLLLLFINSFFNAEPALKVGALRAGMLTLAPVLGLCPSRAALSDTAKVPKPTTGTLYSL